MQQLTEKEQIALNWIEKNIYNDEFSNNFLVENFQLLIDYGLSSPKEAAKYNNCSPNNIYKNHTTFKKLGYTFLNDNK